MILAHLGLSSYNTNHDCTEIKEERSPILSASYMHFIQKQQNVDLYVQIHPSVKPVKPRHHLVSKVRTSLTPAPWWA